MCHRVACSNYCPIVPSLIATQWFQDQSSVLIMDSVDPTLCHMYNVVEKKGRGYNIKNDTTMVQNNTELYCTRHNPCWF